MKEINIVLESSSYNIYIEENILNKASSLISSVYKGNRIIIITDDNVKGLYLNRLMDILKDKYNVDFISITPGEESKCINTYLRVVEGLLDKGIRRGDLLIALGGGVVGDLCGFIAGTIYRGIPYINIPTSLLSQMDSSIGGKTGIDFYGRKNILGAFKQPLLVLIDPALLNTLPDVEFYNGSAELIKHAIIGDSSLFKLLDGSRVINEEIIYKSLMVKARIVMKDEFDLNERMLLNFGHTLGHIVELDRNIRHGEAVSLGILMALRLGIALGITRPSVYEPIKEILNKYHLPTYDIDYKEYLSRAIYDKKNISGTISFILIKNINEPVIYKINEEKLKEVS